MSQNPGEPNTGGASDSASPQQLMQQLVQMLGQQPGSGAGQQATNVVKSIEDRLAALEQRLQAVSARVESAGGEGVASDAALADKLKEVIRTVLVESGFLEKFVSSMVDRKLAEGGGGAAGDARGEAARLTKEFLASNLGTILENDLKPAIQKEVTQHLSGEQMKLLLDEKFRAVTVYLKTDVIPNAVRQAMNNPNMQRA